MNRPRPSFALQVQPSSRQQWTELAQKTEAAGFDALCVADHPGSTVSPFVALAAAAAVTETISLGTSVVNGGVRQALDVAGDVASLDLVSDGRSFLGLGAGHTPSEWAAIGQEYSTPRQRIDRLAELLATVPRLIAGETVDFDGDHVKLQGAALAFTTGRPVPLLVGGSNRRLLRHGAQKADVVELTGSGRTLPDGHYHEPRWSQSDVDRDAGVVADAAGRAGRHPVLGALVQHVEITDDAEGATAHYLHQVAKVVPAEAIPSVADALAVPFMLVGTTTEILSKLDDLSGRWGFSRYTVRSLEAVAQLIAAMRA